MDTLNAFNSAIQRRSPSALILEHVILRRAPAFVSPEIDPAARIPVLIPSSALKRMSPATTLMPALLKRRKRTIHRSRPSFQLWSLH